MSLSIQNIFETIVAVEYLKFCNPYESKPCISEKDAPVTPAQTAFVCVDPEEVGVYSVCSKNNS